MAEPVSGRPAVVGSAVLAAAQSVRREARAGDSMALVEEGELALHAPPPAVSVAPGRAVEIAEVTTTKGGC